MNIAFFCLPGLQTFIKPISEHFSAIDGLSVRLCLSTDGREIQDTVQWADVLWLEWANEMADFITNSFSPLLMKKERVVCRLHSYECLHGYVSKVNWSVISDLVFVAEHVREYSSPDLSGFKGTIHVVPNGIDVSKLDFVERGHGGRIAFLGNMSSKKGPMLLLHAFDFLSRYYPNSGRDFELHIAGSWQEKRFDVYYDHALRRLGLESRVFCYGKIEDVNGWLQDKNYVVCTSPWESQNLGIMEAMGCGVKPLIHHFPGASLIYDDDFLWDSVVDLARMVDRISPYESSRYRDFVSSRYGFDTVIRDIENLVLGEKGAM